MARLLRYKDLSYSEKKRIPLNGCGGKGGWIPVPDFMFTASCDQHDFQYWRGHTERDRKEADRAFLRAMKRDVSALKWWRRPTAYLVAQTYYRAVRLFGGKFFNYSNRYSTREDIGR